MYENLRSVLLLFSSVTIDVYTDERYHSKHGTCLRVEEVVTLLCTGWSVDDTPVTETNRSRSRSRVTFHRTVLLP